jgi:sialic acid synthase SpsE
MNDKSIIIAECCQNHNGKKELLKKMIHMAAENGADYVKIQAIKSRDLSFRERFENGEIDNEGLIKTIKRPYKAELERLEKLDLTLDDEFWFVRECKIAGVKSMTTIFTRTAVKEVSETGYDAIKIASYDCASIPLLNDIKKLNKKMFISTGATYDSEIQEAVNNLKDVDFELLHCVTIYPTPLNELHLNRIKFLKKFTPNVGYSDHSKPSKTGLMASKIALALGATNIERHYTVLSENETKDGPVSINPEMLNQLRFFADLNNSDQWEIINKDYPNWKVSLGNANRKLSHLELLNRDYYRGRFINRIGDNEFFNWA